MEFIMVIVFIAIAFGKAALSAEEKKGSASGNAGAEKASGAERKAVSTSPLGAFGAMFREEEGEKRPVISASNMRKAFEDRASEPESAGVRAEKEQKRRHAIERRQSEKRWADARRQQADSLRVHAAGVDSCEGRLESLRVLYDAGILDREEYAQRVARVKAQHTHK